MMTLYWNLLVKCQNSRSFCRLGEVFLKKRCFSTSLALLCKKIVFQLDKPLYSKEMVGVSRSSSRAETSSNASTTTVNADKLGTEHAVSPGSLNIHKCKQHCNTSRMDCDRSRRVHRGSCEPTGCLSA